MVAFLVLPTLGFAVWVLIEAGGESAVDPELLALAEGNAGGAVIAIAGTEHTSFHWPGALPTESAPRTDGRLTLVWFTGPSCRDCERMTFVHRVMADFRDEVVTVEKAIDRDTSDERLGVTGIPAVVLLDVHGDERGRLATGAAVSEAEFRAWLRGLLEKDCC